MPSFTPNSLTHSLTQPLQPQNPFVQPKAKPANTEQDRDARLAAVEARLNAQEKRGVQKGGGKLAEKLEESKRTQGQSDTAPVVRNDDVAEMWKN
ncbi:hypothetical protein BCR33DRAFT_724360 [Rhizoclosmatium globosum]|uniref:Uncharacterized protein n=1 Tax=Rhizoclosmatium globosum TaxID=329046 RepID=A0A1Y2B646_9FUNG|nr:hypothetical protein BCR33DRAFT_724360 [Rhizoclosmatium globosum]|eukprot:ORY30319.1 hypothetical protein BCR33DRAFT_724360 [Rhizoclosmatium globosum]